MLSLLISLEQKLGRFAIPGLLRIIITLQVVVWLLTKLGQAGGDLVGNLFFVPPSLLPDAEWWRFVSFLVVPTGNSFIWVLMGVPFMWMVSDGLEHAWGSFRVNLYLLACVICVDANAMMHTSIIYSSSAILASTVMVYAVYFPDQEISIYGIIPLKMKWIGWMDFGFLLFTFLSEPDLRWYVFASLVPFLIVFGPGMSQLMHRKVKTMERRQRFEAGKLSSGDSLHRCSRCGKTELDHPGLDFRVNAEGDDVCSECRAAASK